MSREVLGAGGPDVEPLVPMPHQRSTTTMVTDLDAPEPIDVAEPERPPVRPSPVVPRGRRGAGSPGTGAALPAWLRTAWGLAAAVTAGALVASLVTVSVSERQSELERMAAVRLLADLQWPSQGLTMSGEQPVRLNLSVFNPGLDAVEILDARFRGTQSSSIDVEETTAVPAGKTVQVPTLVRVDCTDARPNALELSVRTADGRTRTVSPASAVTAVVGGGRFDVLAFLCDSRGANPVEIWSTTARDDGTLSFQMRNTSESPVQIFFNGPTGTRIATDPPSPITVPARDSVFLVATVVVDRCTSAAQRAAAGSDVRIVVDGEVSDLFTDNTVVAGWLARSVALVCR